jgi:hypothetical protein
VLNVRPVNSGVRRFVVSSDRHKFQEENLKMKSKMSRTSLSCLLFLVAGFLVLFSPFVCKGQNNSAECKWVWKWVDDYEYNPATKQTEYRQVWKYVFDCPQTSSQTSGNSNSESAKKPIEAQTAPSKTGSSRKLIIGTYEIKAITEKFQERVTFKIEIENVGVNGEVKARVYKDNDEGQLKGRVDSNGRLVLKGALVHNIKGLGKSYEYGFELKATVENDTLVNGSYREQYGDREFGGTFDKGTLKEEF